MMVVSRDDWVTELACLPTAAVHHQPIIARTILDRQYVTHTIRYAYTTVALLDVK